MAEGSKRPGYGGRSYYDIPKPKRADRLPHLPETWRAPTATTAEGAGVAGAHLEEGDGDVGVEETGSFKIEEIDGRRLDVVLSRRFSQSRSYFGAIVEKGAVAINGKVQRKKAFGGLTPGDVVDVRFVPDQSTLPVGPEEIALDVLYEDEDLLVVNKPAGLVVHPGPGHWNGTLLNGLAYYVQGPGRPALVHRLDMDTSGAVLVAKNRPALERLSSQFKERTVRKTYLAFATGNHRAFRNHGPEVGEIIASSIGRSHTDRRKMALVPTEAGGRLAATIVRRIGTSIVRNGEIDLLQVQPRTGRTHQIRVHLASRSSPVLGDGVYGMAAVNRRYARLAPRLMLHAHRLSFDHPRHGSRVDIVAPLPADMRKLLQGMVPDDPQEELFPKLLGAPVAA